MNNIVKYNICEGRGCKDMYWKLLKNGGGGGGKGVWESNGRGWMDQSKVYPQWGTLRNPFKH
jgi:hypothetical protein